MFKLYTGRVFKGLLALAVLPLGAMLALSAVELGGARGGLGGAEAQQSSCATGIQVINTFDLPQADASRVKGLRISLAPGGRIEAVSPLPLMTIPGADGELTYLYNTLRAVSAIQVTSCVSTGTPPEVQSANWLIEQDGKSMVQAVALNQIRQELRQGSVIPLLPKQTTRYAVPCDLTDASGIVLVNRGMPVTQQTQVCLTSQDALTRLQRALQQANDQLASPWGMLFNRAGLTQQIAQLNQAMAALYQLSPYVGTVAGVHRDQANPDRLWIQLDVEEALSVP